MKNKILTTKKFLSNEIDRTAFPLIDNWLEDDNQEAQTLKNVLIKFARLHVKAAIKKCIESAPSGSSTDTVSYEDVVKALTNCYPLNNIK